VDVGSEVSGDVDVGDCVVGDVDVGSEVSGDVEVGGCVVGCILSIVRGENVVVSIFGVNVSFV